MANADQLKALVRSHADGDDARFFAVAMQVAAQAARSGHGKFAQELRDLVDQSKAKRSADRAAKPIPVAKPRGELAGLITASYPKTRLADMALDDLVRHRIERVLTEQRQRDRLRQHGFAPMRKLLLIGPPGTGKTMTASALAGELGLPLFTIQLDGLITKYMGETAAKLRLVSMRSRPREACIFLTSSTPSEQSARQRTRLARSGAFLTPFFSFWSRTSRIA
jgi:SpoVK/Ycf46/Vps4 family AAA+-type ATPase